MKTISKILVVSAALLSLGLTSLDAQACGACQRRVHYRVVHYYTDYYPSCGCGCNTCNYCNTCGYGYGGGLFGWLF